MIIFELMQKYTVDSSAVDKATDRIIAKNDQAKRSFDKVKDSADRLTAPAPAFTLPVTDAVIRESEKARRALDRVYDARGRLFRESGRALNPDGFLPQFSNVRNASTVSQPAPAAPVFSPLNPRGLAILNPAPLSPSASPSSFSSPSVSRSFPSAAQLTASKAAAVSLTSSLDSAEDAAGRLNRQTAAVSGSMRNATAASARLGQTGSSAFNSMTSSARSLLYQVAAVAGIYAGVSQAVSLTQAAVKQSIDFESGQIGLAASLSSNFVFGESKVASFGDAVLVAQGYMDRLVKASVELPGTFNDFQQISTAISGSTFAIGKNLDDLLETTKSLALLNNIIPGQNAYDTGNQASRILTGQASVGDNPLFAYLKGANFLKTGGGEFNSLPAIERYNRLQQALQDATGNPAFRSAVSSSASTQLSTLKDYLTGINGVLGVTGSIVRNDVTQEAARLNGILGQSPDRIRGIGTFIASGITPFITAGGAALEFVTTRFDTLRSTAIISASALTAATLASAAFGKAGLVAGGASAVSSLYSTAALAAAVYPLIGISGLASAGLASFTAFLTPAVAGLAVLAPAAGIVAIGAAAIVGVISVLRTDFLGLGTMARNAGGFLGSQLITVGQNLYGLLVAVGQPLAVFIIPVLSGLAYVLGGILWVANQLTDLIYSSVSAIGAFIGALTVDPFDISGATAQARAAFNEFSMQKFSEAALTSGSTAAAPAAAKAPAAYNVAQAGDTFNINLNGPITRGAVDQGTIREIELAIRRAAERSRRFNPQLPAEAL